MQDKDELGRRGEQLAAEYLERAGLRILDRNWRCENGELDIVALRTPGPGRLRGQDPVGRRYGSPLEAVSHGKRARLRRLAACVAGAHGLRFDEVRIDVIGLVRDRAGRVHRRARAGGGLSAASPARTRSPWSASRAIRSRSRPTSRTACPGYSWSGLPDTALREARDRIRAAIVNSREQWPQRRITVGLSPASLPKRGSGFDLGIAVAILGAAGLGPGGGPRRGRVPRRTGARRPAAPGARRAARGRRRGGRRVPAGGRAERQRRRGRAGPRPPGAGAGTLRGLLGWLRVGRPSSRTRCRRRRRATAPAGAAVTGMPGRRWPGRTWPTCWASRRPAGRRRSARPAATTCACSGRRARARRCWPSGCPTVLPPPGPGRGAGGDLDPLGGRACCRTGSAAADRAAVLRPAPHRDQGGDRRRRQRGDPARGGLAGASRLPVPGRGARVRPGRARRAAPAAGVGRGRGGPVGRDRAVPGPLHAGAGGEPVPVRQGTRAAGGLRPARPRSAAGTWPGCPGRCSTGWT